jgi:protoporphyrinogen oxidase
VAVLGAGLAGLRAAHELGRRGLDVKVYEARSEVGGRAGGLWCEGHWMDAAWPVLGGRDRSLARWARDLGLGDAFMPLRPVQTTLFWKGESTPVDGLSLRGAARIPGPPIWERPKLLRWARLFQRYAPKLDPMFPERAADLDYRSIRDHVALYFGKGALEFWLTPEVQGLYGDSVEELSRVALLMQAAAVGIGERRPGASGLPRRPLFELAQAAAEALDLRRSTTVLRVDEEPAGGFRIETSDADGERTEACFDAVVVALGPPAAARVAAPLLTPAERDFFAAVTERPALTLALAIDGIEGGLPAEWRLPRRESSEIASLVMEPGQPDGRVPEGRSQIVALARDGFAKHWREMADDVVTKTLVAELSRLKPGLGERVLATELNRATVPFFSVGSYRRLAGFRKVQRDRRSLGRRLYWAGDYLGGPGFEATSLSGLRAANDLVSDLELA